MNLAFCCGASTSPSASYLSVLYAAVERYGSPDTVVTDGCGVFRARQARAVYEALGIAKHEIATRRWARQWLATAGSFWGSDPLTRAIPSLCPLAR